MKKTTKQYDFTEDAPLTANEPALAYDYSDKSKTCFAPTADKWNPNFPIHCTQEEFAEYIHELEQVPFETWEEHQKKFYECKRKLLASFI